MALAIRCALHTKQGVGTMKTNEYNSRALHRVFCILLTVLNLIENHKTYPERSESMFKHPDHISVF